MKTLSVAIFILGYLLQQSQAVYGTCHAYPGAVASDCLELIGNNLGNDEIHVLGSTGRYTITLRNCSITTVGTPTTEVDVDEIVRMALAEIGYCALSDRGSISGTYTNHEGLKVCYLYPGREQSCT